MPVVYGKIWDNDIRSRINNAILNEKKNIGPECLMHYEIDARHIIKNLDPIARAIDQNVLGAIRATSL